MDKEGIVYSCVEQYFTAKKALFFDDTANYTKIMQEKNPKKQKQWGRNVSNFSEQRWYGISTENNPAKEIMYAGNYYKYAQNEKLKKLLLDTAGTQLVEASYDLIWGIGQKSGQLGANLKQCWKGKNWLGEILTLIRDDIVKKENRLF